jgi:phage/conjugal plasmid C-4 type zinc finger TraR family protein
MSDDADLAQGFETFRRDMALARALAPEPERRPRASGCCAACGDEIEPERLAVHPGARRCLVCQEALERQRRICVRA